MYKLTSCWISDIKCTIFLTVKIEKKKLQHFDITIKARIG